MGQVPTRRLHGAQMFRHKQFESNARRHADSLEEKLVGFTYHRAGATKREISNKQGRVLLLLFIQVLPYATLSGYDRRQGRVWCIFVLVLC